jgi:hypothetical protein
MFVIENAKRLLEFVEAVVNSVAEIASGAIGKAANWIETALGNMIPIVIGFLARMIGLGGIADTVKDIIKKVQGKVDQAIDKLLEKVIAGIKKAGTAVVQAGVPQDPKERLRLAAQAATSAARRLSGKVTRSLLTPVLAGIKLRYGLKDIVPYERGGRWWARISINPEVEQNLDVPSADAAPTSAPSGVPPGPEEQARQRKAAEETKAALKQLLSAGAPKAKLQATITQLRASHRWQTLELQSKGSNQFNIFGGFSPGFSILEVDDVMWVIQLKNMKVPEGIRASWQAYENWVRDNVIRGTGKPGVLADVAQAEGATAEQVPITATGRTSMRAGTALPPAGTVRYYREPVLGSRDRPDAAIVTPREIFTVEITLKSDWAMLERTSGLEGRINNRMNSQRIHKISQIPAHVFQLQQQFPKHVQIHVIIISDAPPSAASKARVKEWMTGQIGKAGNVDVIWVVA